MEMMNHTLHSLLLLCLLGIGVSLNGFSQDMDLKWVRHITSDSGNVDPINVYTDPHGNTYFYGQFSYDSVRFDTIVDGIQWGVGGVMIKYDSLGNLIRYWLPKGIKPSAGIDYRTLIPTEHGLYMAISLSDTVILPNETIHSYGEADVLIERWDKNDSIIWRTRIAGGEVEVWNLQVTSNGDVIGQGHFRDSMSVNGTTFYTDNKYARQWDNFLFRLNDKGNVKWVKVVSKGGEHVRHGLLVDKSDNIYFAASFNDTIRFSNTTLYHHLTIFNNKIFLAKFSPKGEEIWVKSFGSESKNDALYDFEMDSKDRIQVLYANGDTDVEIDGIPIPKGSVWLDFNTDGQLQEVVHVFENCTEFCINRNDEKLATNSPSSKVLFQKYSTQNQFTNIQALAGNDFLGSSFLIDVNKHDQVVVAGPFSNEIIIGVDTLNTKGGRDTYIAFYQDHTVTTVNEARELDYDFQIYPNPAVDRVTLVLDLPNPQKITIRLTDIQGQEVYYKDLGSTQAGNHELQLDLSSYAAGFYQLTCQTGNTPICRKLVLH
ncbi:T9SS type A sorting domain-containing protein [bacterium SCSIO 12741]|nr:T9SS type A sorting domain-containing protein [bacterium SCSIO 12741]